MESWLGGPTVKRRWLREWIREQHEKEQRVFWRMGKVFISLYMCLSSPFSPSLAAQGGWQGAEWLPERLHYRLQITGCH